MTFISLQFWFELFNYCKAKWTNLVFWCGSDTKLYLSLFYILLSRFTCNSQNSSRFLTCVVILVPESVFCWVTLLHRFDWQRVNLLLLVLMIGKMISFQYIHSLLLLTIPDYSRPVFSLGICVVWTRIFTWDVYWGTFQSTDSPFYIIHSQAGFVNGT